MTKFSRFKDFRLPIIGHDLTNSTKPLDPETFDGDDKIGDILTIVARKTGAATLDQIFDLEIVGAEDTPQEDYRLQSLPIGLEKLRLQFLSDLLLI